MGFFERAKSVGQAAGELLTNTAASVSTAVTPASAVAVAAAPAEQPERVLNSLTTLTLPAPTAEWLGPPLASLSLELTTENIEVWGTLGRSFHVIKNAAGEKRVILHFPREVLEDDAAWFYAQSIPQGIKGTIEPLQPLIVVSEGLNAPHIVYSLMVEPSWESQYGFKMSFVPWRHLEELKGLKESELQRFLPVILKVADLQQAAARPVRKIREMAPEDVDTLVQVLANIVYLKDNGAPGWRTFFEQSGMDEITTSLSFEGAVADVARRVVSTLKLYAPLTKYPNDEVLALLVVGVWRRQDLGDINKRKIDKIIQTYNITIRPLD